MAARKRLLAGALASVTFGVTALMSPPGAGAAPAPSLGYDATTDFGSLYNIERIVGAQDLWAAGFTGKGVDVALIDTGVSPVAGLSDPDKIVFGPDVSTDNGNEDLRYLDSYGHGTHMAGIIAGRDGTTAGKGYADPKKFNGVAPDARIVSVKAGATDGATDVQQVIAGINWVVDHKDADGLNIRVLNLSFGTDSVQPYLIDPLTFAVERAWNAGIVVIVAAGNDGLATLQVANPATDPKVVTVGAAEPNGTLDVKDDTVPAFAQHGNLVRSVDVIAPATHVLSLRVPGSWIDVNNPGGVVGDRFLRGSGTSQATAVTSGLAALLVQKFPNASPDQIKAYLTSTARPIGNLSSLKLGLGSLGGLTGLSGLGLGTNPVTNFYAGNGVVTGAKAVSMRALAPALQLTIPATGLGSLDASRGSGSLLLDGVAVRGQLELLGLTLGTSTAGVDGEWDGNRWTGNRWTDGSWTGNRWTGNRWTGNRWTGNRWTGNRWTGNRWTVGIWS
jgi:serine protease AprX